MTLCCDHYGDRKESRPGFGPRLIVRYDNATYCSPNVGFRPL